MNSDDFRNILNKINISQADLARLLDVTTRSVNLWATGVRNIPSPVSAYLKLLSSLPTGMQQAELARLNEEKITMKEGLYFVEYAGMAGNGGASLIFEGGRIFGSDIAGAKYDGEYLLNEASGMFDITIKVQMPAHVESVIGIVQPFDWILEVFTTMSPHADSGNMNVRTKHDNSKIVAAYRFMRSIPLAA